MNYQLMFQTIAVLCGFATIISILAWVIVANLTYSSTKNIKRCIFGFFIITVITAALAAGLS